MRFLVRPMPAALLLALVVRLLYLAAFRHSPFFEHLLVDAEWHDQWALDWAQGAWRPGDEAFFRAPLYPFFLSWLYRLLGHDLTAVRVVSAVMGALGAAAMAGTAARWSQRAGRWAALLAGVYGPLVFFGGELLIPNMLVVLLAWAMYFATATPRWRHLLAAAVLLGLAGIARPNAIVLLLPLGWLASRALASARWPSPARLLVLAAVVLAPAALVTAVNWKAERAFVFVGSQGGVNFAAGNHALATGRSVEVPGLKEVANWEEFVEKSRTLAEKARGRPLNSREVSDYWYGLGFAWIRTHPGDAVRLTLKKAYYLVNAYESPNNRDLYFRQPWPLRPLLWKIGWFAFPWGLVFPLAVAGWWIGRRGVGTGLTVNTLAGWCLVYGASVVPFFVTARFRMGLVPPLIVLAALALDRWRELRRIGPAAAFLIAFVVANSALFSARIDNPGQELARLGAVLLEKGDFDGGIQVLEEAIALDPGGVAPNYLLADAYLETGRQPRRCMELYDKVVSLRPGDAKARFGLASAYLMLERWDDAARELGVVLELDSSDAATWVNLGVAREGMGDMAGAREAYLMGIEHAPKEDLAYARLAGLEIAQRDVDAALSALNRGIEKAPNSFLLRFQRGAMLIQLGRPREAAPDVQAARRLEPQNPDGARLEQMLLKMASDP